MQIDNTQSLGSVGTAKKISPRNPDFRPDPVLHLQKGGMRPMANDSKKQQIMADLERLTTEADQLPEGEQRQQLVAQIAKLNVEYQAED
jgi:hypothetical protein